MIIRRLHIKNLRNHICTDITFSPRLNFIYGPNGAGKTTILEAIHICSFGKSFQPTQENLLITFGEQTYNLVCECRSDLNVPYNIKVEYKIGRRKSICTTQGDNLTAKNLIGELPCVILSPDFRVITSGTPSDRRQFVDKILSQCSKAYFEDLLELRKILKQRNSLLSSYNSIEKFDDTLLHLWNEQFFEISARVIYKRQIFSQEFPEYFQSVYNKIANDREIVGLKYIPNSIESIYNNEKCDISSIHNSLKNKAIQIEKIEKYRGMTLFGPQKDEFEITINEAISRDIASQGQHKSLLISLKIAEFTYLKELNRETPVILLDDIFSELDAERIQKVVNIIEYLNAQTFITTTEFDQRNRTFELNGDSKRLYLFNGQVNFE